jgi:hypothetical protein
LQSTSQEYKRRADQHRRELQFEVGDLILAHLRKERFPRGTYNKLKMKKIGPCKVIRNLGQTHMRLNYPMGSESHRYSMLQICTLTELKKQEQRMEQKEIQWTKQMPVAEKPQMESIIDKRISRKTRRKGVF